MTAPGHRTRIRQGVKPLRQPVAWITGASSGIGAEIAREFAYIGLRTILTARRRSHLDAVARSITSAGGTAEVEVCDVSNPAAVERAQRNILRRHRAIDLLVNNAGVTVFSTFSQTSIADFERIIGANLLGAIYCTKAVLPRMISRGDGWIFNVLSTAAVKTFEGSAAYTATKAGLLGLSDVLREEMRGRGVRVVNVIPGPADTPMWSAETRRKEKKRMMTPRGVAEALIAAYRMPPEAVLETIVVRPPTGDL